MFVQHVLRYRGNVFTLSNYVMVCVFKLWVKVNGRMILSMDALFGLPRKRSSGLSCRDALHGTVYFVHQPSVDEFVQSTALEKIPQVEY